MRDFEAEKAQIEEEHGPEPTLQKWRAEAALLNDAIAAEEARLSNAYDQMPALSDAEREEAAQRVAGRSS